jgi:hypothetical protein
MTNRISTRHGIAIHGGFWLQRGARMMMSLQIYHRGRLGVNDGTCWDATRQGLYFYATCIVHLAFPLKKNHMH